MDVVVRKSSAILELLTSEDKSLLVWWDTLLVLDLGFDVLNGVSWLNIESNGLSSQGLDEDLHTTSESQHKMESGLLLDVVIGEGSAVFELLTSEDESLLIWWNTFLVLDLGFHIFNSVCWLDIEGDDLTSDGILISCILRVNETTRFTRSISYITELRTGTLNDINSVRAQLWKSIVRISILKSIKEITD